MEKFTQLTGLVVPLDRSNVDTDAIIPARYLNTSEPAELASHCMEDMDTGFAATVAPGDFIVALDLAGQWVKPDSEGTIRPQLERWRSQAQGDLVFLIGGSNGLAPDLLRSCRERILLSQMTFTHQMARLILLEILANAWRCSV